MKAPKPPLALSINRESRREALPVYAPLFTQWNDETRLIAIISPEIDNLAIPISTFPGAPHFGRLAEENRLVNTRIANILTWGSNLEYFTKEADYNLQSLDNLKRIGRGDDDDMMGFPWQRPALSFGKIEVWSVQIWKEEDMKIGEKEWEAPLVKFRTWFRGVQNIIGEKTFRVPRLLRVVDSKGNVLASVAGREEDVKKQT